MIRLRAILKDEKTKEYQIINQILGKNKGIPEVDLEQGYNGNFYLAGYAPEKPESIRAEEEIAELKKMLTGTDYAIIKIAEGVASPEEYADVIAQRAQWRERINELEKIIE